MFEQLYFLGIADAIIVAIGAYLIIRNYRVAREIKDLRVFVEKASNAINSGYSLQEALVEASKHSKLAKRLVYSAKKLGVSNAFKKCAEKSASRFASIVCNMFSVVTREERGSLKILQDVSEFLTLKERIMRETTATVISSTAISVTLLVLFLFSSVLASTLLGSSFKSTVAGFQEDVKLFALVSGVLVGVASGGIDGSVKRAVLLSVLLASIFYTVVVLVGRL